MEASPRRSCSYSCGSGTMALCGARNRRHDAASASQNTASTTQSEDTGPGAPRHTLEALASSSKRRRRPWLLHNTSGASICSTRMCRRETSNPGSRSRRHERASTSLGYRSEQDAESGFAGPAGARGIAHSVTHARGHGPGGHGSSCSVCLLHSQCPGVLYAFRMSVLLCAGSGLAARYAACQVPQCLYKRASCS